MPKNPIGYASEDKWDVGRWFQSVGDKVAYAVDGEKECHTNTKKQKQLGFSGVDKLMSTVFMNFVGIVNA